MVDPCLICGKRIPFSFSWRELLTLKPFSRALLYPVQHWLCLECHKELEWIEEGCSRCSKPLKTPQHRPAASAKTGWTEARLTKARSTFSGEAAISDEATAIPSGTTATFGEARANTGRTITASAGTFDGILCDDCERWLIWEEEQENRPVLIRNISVLRYNRWAQEVLIRYKFRGDERLKYLLASLLVYSPHQNLLQQLFLTADLITSIPLSPSRLKERGFNQAERVAELVAHFFNKPFLPHLLLCQDDEEKQSKRGRQERLAKIFDRFLNNPHHLADIKNKRIIVMDDIYTTGATLHAAAHCLRQGGAWEVTGVTIAR